MRLVLPFLLAWSLACASGTSTPEAPTTPEAKVARAIELGKVVRADPEGAEAALVEAGSSADELEALMVEIAADEAMSDAYAEAVAP